MPDTRGASRLLPLTVIAAALTATLSGCSGTSSGAQPLDPTVRHVQPGAPGEPNEILTEAPAPQLELASPFTPADVAFLEDMKVHHRQALRMSALVPEREQREDLVLFARRMDISQEGELEQVERLLAEHEAALERTGTTGHGDGHDSGHDGDETDHADMPGMLTEAELTALEAASGEQFVRLFLDGMMRHHEGALRMVADLFADEQAAGDPRVFSFANDVDADQRIEISRMARLQAELDAR